jgi:opacity protein-like surface antigen
MRHFARTLSASLPIALLLAALAAPDARAGMLTDVEGMTSTVMQKNQSSFSGIALRVRLQPPQLLKQISLMPTLEYWRAAATIEDFGIEAARKDATLGVDGRYDFDAGSFQPYLGAGFAIHFLSQEVDAPQLGLADESTSLMKGGLTFLGGASFLITERLGNFLEVKYHHVTDHEQLKINFGLGYRL